VCFSGRLKKKKKRKDLKEEIKYSENREEILSRLLKPKQSHSS